MFPFQGPSQSDTPHSYHPTVVKLCLTFTVGSGFDATKQVAHSFLRFNTSMKPISTLALSAPLLVSPTVLCSEENRGGISFMSLLELSPLEAGKQTENL